MSTRLTPTSLTDTGRVHMTLMIFHELMHLPQAMSIVQDRLNANKPPTPVPDAKSGKLPPGQINNNRDLDVDIKKEEPSFFGSFFSSAKKGQPKKAGPIMEAVRLSHIPEYIAY